MSCPIPATPEARKKTTRDALRRREQHPWSSCHHCSSRYVSLWIHGGIGGVGDCVPQLEVLAALKSELCLGLALCALESQDNLLGGLCLLVEDRLGLTTVTGLLTVVTTLTLGEQRGLEKEKKNCMSFCCLCILMDSSCALSVPCQPCTG